jgi:lysophospholipase L1-like esterase
MAQLRKASAISLLTGTNDIWQGYDNGLEMRLAVIAKLMPEDVPLIWSTIPPMLDSDRPYEVNRHIKALARARRNTHVIDTWDLFTHGSGQAVIREYFLEDRVHLSPAGYRKWIGAILQAMPVPATA